MDETAAATTTVRESGNKLTTVVDQVIVWTMDQFRDNGWNSNRKISSKRKWKQIQ